MKDSVDWLYSFSAVKAHESVGRHAKTVVRPRKFATHKETCFVNKIILDSMNGSQLIGLDSLGIDIYTIYGYFHRLKVG